MRKAIGAGPDRHGLAIGVLVGTTAVVFGEVVTHGFTQWDDPTYVTQNPLIRGLDWPRICHVFTTYNFSNYHPFTYLTYMVEYALVGPSPWLYHLNNLLLHMAAGVFAYLCGLRLFSRGGSMPRAPAFIAALLFLLHPLRVESVAWVSERKDVLCAVFYLAAFWVYLRAAASAGRRRRIEYSAALLLFVAALLSKVMAISLPCVLVVYHLVCRPAWRRWVLGCVPFFGLSIVFGVVGAQAQAGGGAVQGPHGGSWGLHVLSVFKAVGFYATKLVWPADLSARYLDKAAHGVSDPLVGLGLAMTAAAIVVFWWALKRRSVMAFALGWFVVVWAPVSGIVPSTTLVADRYMYLPALGLFWALAWGADLGWSRLQRAGRNRWGGVLQVAAGVVLFALSCVSFERVRVWRDNESVWLDALRENPSNHVAFNQLSATAAMNGDFATALEYSRKAVEGGFRKPEYLFNLCRAHRGLRSYDNELASARALVAGAPSFLPARLVLLRHLIEDGRLAEASASMERLRADGLRLHPDVLNASAALSFARGEVEAALELYRASLQASPDNAEALLGVAECLAKLGALPEAERVVQAALAVPGAIWFPDLTQRVAVLREQTSSATRNG